MPRDRVEVAKRTVDAYNRRDVDVLFAELATPDFEWHPGLVRALDGGAYRGREGVERFALDTREKVLDPAHPVMAESLRNLGEFYRGQGAYARAEPLLRRALDIQEQVLGATHREASRQVVHTTWGEVIALMVMHLFVAAIGVGLFSQLLPLRRRPAAPSGLGWQPVNDPRRGQQS